MATAEDLASAEGVEKGEGTWDAVRRLQSRREEDAAQFLSEEPKEGRV